MGSYNSICRLFFGAMLVQTLLSAECLECETILKKANQNTLCLLDGTCIDSEQQSLTLGEIKNLYAKKKDFSSMDYYKIGLINYKSGDFESAKMNFEKSLKIEPSFPWPANALGFCYENGLGVKIDKDRAIHYYLIAASSDHQMAQFRLSGLLKEREIEFLSMSAANGNNEALYRMGLKFLNGNGVPQNDILALAIMQYLGGDREYHPKSLADFEEMYKKEKSDSLRKICGTLKSRMSTKQIEESNQLRFDPSKMFELIKV